jgi:hypothetical protein
MDKRGLFRVNYYENGQPKTNFVVAYTDVEAAQFMGVTGNSGVQVTQDRFPVEVAGIDAPHAAVASIPVTVAPFDLPRTVSREEFDALNMRISDLLTRMAGGGKKV